MYDKSYKSCSRSDYMANSILVTYLQQAIQLI